MPFIKAIKEIDVKVKPLYSSADLAAISFVNYCMDDTYKDHKERGAMIYKLDLYFNDDRKTLVSRYYYSSIYRGVHNNVVWAFIQEYFFKSWNYIFFKSWQDQNNIFKVKSCYKYAFCHTHPSYCNGHRSDCFSKEDKWLVNLLKLKYCYVGIPKGQVLRYGGGDNNGDVIFEDSPKTPHTRLYYCKKKKQKQP